MQEEKKRQEKKGFLFLTGARRNPAAFNRRGGHCCGGQVSPGQGWQERASVAVGLLLLEPGQWLLPLPNVGVWRGPPRFSVGSSVGQGSAGALQRVRSASCFIFLCSARKKRGENQHRLHQTWHVLTWGLAKSFTTPLCFPVQGLGLQADDWDADFQPWHKELSDVTGLRVQKMMKEKLHCDCHVAKTRRFSLFYNVWGSFGQSRPEFNCLCLPEAHFP